MVLSKNRRKRLNWLREELEDLKKKNLYRTLRTLASRQGKEIVIDGRRFLNFSSNDYLSLAKEFSLDKVLLTCDKNNIGCFKKVMGRLYSGIYFM